MSGLEKKPKCECRKNNIPTCYVASAGCADDDAAVAALPDVWVPRHSGPILANYLKEREHNHEKVLQDISDGANTVNENVNCKIHALAEALLAHIQRNNKEMGCIIKNSNIILKKECRDQAHQEIYKLHAQLIDEMAHFKREAFVLERERADGLRILFRDQFQRLISVGHRTPKDLLHDFDERAYEINQQLLSNTRAYVDLEAKLRVHLEESVGRARSGINQLCLNMKIRRGSALPWPCEERHIIRRSSSAVGVNKREPSTPTVNLISDIKEIDLCITYLVQTYKAAVIRVFTDFSKRLCDLEKDLNSHHYFVNLDTHTCEASEFHRMVDTTVRRLSNSIHKKHMNSRELDVNGSDILAMQKSLWSIGQCLQDTFKILHDAGHLWDSHILRQALAQKLTIAAVEDLLTSNDAIEMANEIAFNVALENLRGISDMDKLQLQYEAIEGMLERTADMYRQHSEAELGRLEEFMKLPTSFAKTLLAEFQYFLDVHPRSTPHVGVNGQCSNEQGSVSPRTTANALLLPLPRAILQTELQEVALRNWRNGFLETFESNVSMVPEELRRQARVWVEERANVLHARFSLKMVSHCVRLERIKALRDLRMSELLYHETRLNSHLDALFAVVENLPMEAGGFSSLDAPYLYPFCDWIKSIQTGIDALSQSQEPADVEVKRLKISSYALRLAKHRNLFEESLDRAVDGYRRSLEHRIQNVRISTVRFMSQIKLFSEGGKYSALEATRASNALTKGSEALESCVNRVMGALDSRRTQLLSQADQLMAPLQRKCEEVLGKAGVKNAKGKPPKKK